MDILQHKISTFPIENTLEDFPGLSFYLSQSDTALTAFNTQATLQVDQAYIDTVILSKSMMDNCESILIYGFINNAPFKIPISQIFNADFSSETLEVKVEDVLSGIDLVTLGNENPKTRTIKLTGQDTTTIPQTLPPFGEAYVKTIPNVLSEAEETAIRYQDFASAKLFYEASLKISLILEELISYEKKMEIAVERHNYEEAIKLRLEIKSLNSMLMLPYQQIVINFTSPPKSDLNTEERAENAADYFEEERSDSEELYLIKPQVPKFADVTPAPITDLKSRGVAPNTAPILTQETPAIVHEESDIEEDESDLPELPTNPSLYKLRNDVEPSITLEEPSVTEPKPSRIPMPKTIVISKLNKELFILEKNIDAVNQKIQSAERLNQHEKLAILLAKRKEYEAALTEAKLKLDLEIKGTHELIEHHNDSTEPIDELDISNNRADTSLMQYLPSSIPLPPVTEQTMSYRYALDIVPFFTPEVFMCLRSTNRNLVAGAVAAISISVTSDPTIERIEAAWAAACLITEASVPLVLHELAPLLTTLISLPIPQNRGQLFSVIATLASMVDEKTAKTNIVASTALSILYALDDDISGRIIQLVTEFEVTSNESKTDMKIENRAACITRMINSGISFTTVTKNLLAEFIKKAIVNSKKSQTRSEVTNTITTALDYDMDILADLFRGKNNIGLNCTKIQLQTILAQLNKALVPSYELISCSFHEGEGFCIRKISSEPIISEPPAPVRLTSPVEFKAPASQNFCCPHCNWTPDAPSGSDSATMTGLIVKHMTEICPLVEHCSGCKKIIPLKMLSYHLKEECPKGSNYFFCDGCGEIFDASQKESHLKSCPNDVDPTKEFRCVMCAKKIPLTDMINHYAVSPGCPECARKPIY